MRFRVFVRGLLAVAMLAGLLTVATAQPAAALVTVTVDSNATDDKNDLGTLRWAIETIAKDNSSDDVLILLETDVNLTCGGGGDIEYWRGQTITIRNNTPGELTITQDCDDERILFFSLGNLIVEGGSGGIVLTGGGGINGPAKGAAINADGFVSISDTKVQDNYASSGGLASGGGVHATGNVTVVRSEVSQNTARSTGGDFALGGGIRSTKGDISVTDSLISGNVTLSWSGGADQESEGGGLNADGKVTVVRSTLFNNRAESNHNDNGQGGGVYAASVEVTDSRFVLNTAGGYGPASSGSRGRGGGIFSLGSVTLTRSELQDNKAESRENSGVGGGIFSQGPVTAHNSTISLNLARVLVSGDSYGGGIWTEGASPVTLNFTTVTQNSAADGANLYIRDSYLGGWASLIAAAVGGGANCTIGVPGSNSAQWFWVDDTSCSLGGNNTVNDGGELPVESDKAVNGAVNGTENHLPNVSSSTVGEIVNGAPCNGYTEDQRGVVRPEGSQCDIGSVELKGLSAVDDTAFTITAYVGRPETTAVLANDNLGESGGMVTVTIYTQPTLGLATANPDNTTTYFPLPLLSTVEEYTYEVCGPVNCDTAKVKVTVNGPPAPEFPEQPETAPTSGPEAAPTSAPRPPAQKPVAPAKAVPAGKTTAPKYTG